MNFGHIFFHQRQYAKWLETLNDFLSAKARKIIGKIYQINNIKDFFLNLSRAKPFFLLKTNEKVKGILSEKSGKSGIIRGKTVKNSWSCFEICMCSLFGKSAVY